MMGATDSLPNLVWLPALHPWLIVLLAGLVFLVAMQSAHRAARASPWAPLVLRLAAVAGIVAMLCNPSLPAPSGRDGLPPLTILIDTSRSMGEPAPDSAGTTTSRLAVLRETWLNPDMLNRFRNSADVRLIAFADQAATVDAGALGSLQPAGQATRLYDTIEASLTALRPASEMASATKTRSGRALVISDANDSSGASPDSLIALARAKGVRLDFALPPSDGPGGPPADLAVSAAPRAPLVTAGSAVPIDVTLTQQGFDGQAVMLTLREITPVERVLAERRIVLGASETVTLAVTPELSPLMTSGLHAVECVATVTPLAAELNTQNNSDPFFVQVTDARIRVAVFEGEPSWDSRAFVAALATDPRFEITVVHALGRRPGALSEPETMRTRRITPGVAHSTEETGIAAPLTQEELNRFDIIALGRRIEALFPGEHAARLARYAQEHGGCLALLRGDPTSSSDSSDAALAREALAPIVPARFGGGAAPATRVFALPAGAQALGAVAPSLDEAPDVDSITRVSDLSPLCSIWLAGLDEERGGTAPALLVAPASRGRVLLNLADGFWRWQLLPAERSGWRRALAAFWPQAMLSFARGNEWTPGQDVSLAVDRLIAAPGEAVTIVVRARGPLAAALDPSVAITQGADSGSQTLGLEASPVQQGVWTATVTPQREGVMTITMPDPATRGQSLSTRIRVRERDAESLHMEPAAQPAARIASATGGALLEWQEAEKYAALLASENLAMQTDTIVEPAWRRWWIFSLIVGALALEWFWRRRTGLA